MEKTYRSISKQMFPECNCSSQPEIRISHKRFLLKTLNQKFVWQNYFPAGTRAGYCLLRKSGDGYR